LCLLCLFVACFCCYIGAITPHFCRINTATIAIATTHVHAPMSR
jgi:hypothetical protein